MLVRGTLAKNLTPKFGKGDRNQRELQDLQ